MVITLQLNKGTSEEKFKLELLRVMSSTDLTAKVTCDQNS